MGTTVTKEERLHRKEADCEFAVEKTGVVAHQHSIFLNSAMNAIQS